MSTREFNVFSGWDEFIYDTRRHVGYDESDFRLTSETRLPQARDTPQATSHVIVEDPISLGGGSRIVCMSEVSRAYVGILRSYPILAARWQQLSTYLLYI